MKKIIEIFLIIIFVTSLCFSQQHEVFLNQHERLNKNGMHVEILSDSPLEKLTLPNIEKSKLKFFQLFYSFETNNDNYFSIAVNQNEERDLLYVDKNNDEDLTNDGEPIIFKHSEDKLVLKFTPEADPNQILHLLIYRTPELHDSLKYDYIDSLGNMSEKSASFWSMMLSKPNFKGKKGTFYYDDRLTMRKGIINIENSNYEFGLFNFSNNGLYNDSDDVIIIDYNKNGVLNYNEKEEIFNIHDIIEIDGNSYKLSYVDKYGNNVIFEKTDIEESKYFVSNIKSNTNNFKKLKQNFWSYKFSTLDNSNYELSKLKGNYILLNFWGEWCKPCIDEIETLVDIQNEWKNKIFIVSFLNSNKLDKAKKLIKEKNMTWLHLKSSKDLEEKFKIFGFPTNILIEPSGQNYIDTNVITKEFLELNIN